MTQRLPHPLHNRADIADGKNAHNDRSAVNSRLYGRASTWFVMLFACVIVVAVSTHLDIILHSLQMQPQMRSGQARNPAIVRASGFLQGRIYNLNFHASSSVIDKINVQLGDEVYKGEVLAQLNQTIQQDNVDVAQKSVDAAQNNVASALANASQTAAAMNASIAAALVSLGVAQANKQAVNLQSDADVVSAETTLRSDQAILRSIRINARAFFHLAAAQLRQSLLNCGVAAGSISAGASATPTGIPGSATGNNVGVCERLAYAQYQQTVDTTRVTVVIAQGQVNEDLADLDAARATAIVNNTAASGQVAVARSQVDVARASAALTSALSQVVANQGQLKITLAQYKLAVDNLQDTTLVAPDAGVVTAVNGTIGGYPGNPNNITAGNGTAGYGPFIRIVDVSHVRQILANVSETDIVRIKVGLAVHFSVKAYAARQFSGTIKSIVREGVNGTASIVFSIIVAIDPASIQGVTLLPNMTANLTIEVV